MNTTNGHGHSSSLVISTTTLVGAKRRKSKIAHKINIEDKVKEKQYFFLKPSSFLF